MEQKVPPGDDTWDRESDLPPQPFDLWTRTNVGENLPFPITPLTATHFPKLFALDTTLVQQGSSSFQPARRFYGRLYFNEGAILHELTEKYSVPASLIDRAWGSRPRGNQQGRAPFRPLRFIRKLPALLRQGMSTTKQQGPKHTPEQFFAQIDQWVNAFMQQDLSLLDDSTLWNRGLPVWRERGGYTWSTNLRISVPSGFLYAVLERLVKWWTGRKFAAQDLVMGLPGIFSAEVGPALWQMAQTLTERGLSNVLLDNSPAAALVLLRERPEAEGFYTQLESFLQRHGHRCPDELEMRNARWAEAPEQIIDLVANYLQAGESVNPIKAEERQRQNQADAIAAIEAKLGPVRRRIFRAVLKKAQRAMTIRDNSRYYMAKFVFPMRRLYAELGRRWAERGWLQRLDDIFFLTVSEIESIVENGVSSTSPQILQTWAANRRIAYEYWLTVVPPDVIGPDGKPIIEDTKSTNTLEGVPASSGRARGRARIVQDVHEAMRLSSGDILVTRATDPGWTPVFPLVSGIVLEIGGQLSHGAIVAREYGIPAVVNVQGAMLKIQDGQTITIDGTNGRIYLDEAGAPNTTSITSGA